MAASSSNLELCGLQHFSLENEQAKSDRVAMSFWDEKKVNKRLVKEKKSPGGLLHGSKAEIGHGCTMCSYDKRFHNAEIRKTFSKLVAMVGEEFLALENRLNYKEEEDTNLEDEVRDQEEEEDDEEEAGDTESVNFDSLEDDEEEDVVDKEDKEEKEVPRDDETLQLALRRLKRPKSASWVKKSP